jgi:hypothetical protein
LLSSMHFYKEVYCTISYGRDLCPGYMNFKHLHFCSGTVAQPLKVDVCQEVYCTLSYGKRPQKFSGIDM